MNDHCDTAVYSKNRTKLVFPCCIDHIRAHYTERVVSHFYEVLIPQVKYTCRNFKDYYRKCICNFIRVTTSSLNLSAIHRWEWNKTQAYPGRNHTAPNTPIACAAEWKWFGSPRVHNLLCSVPNLSVSRWPAQLGFKEVFTRAHSLLVKTNKHN